MIKAKSLKSFWISLISLSFLLSGCNTYNVYWNDLRNVPDEREITILFENKQLDRLKELYLKCNKTKKIIIPAGYFDEGCTHYSDFNFHYFIDYENRKIEIHVVDSFVEGIDNKVLLDSKDSVFAYQLIFTDLENEDLITVVSKDSLIEIPNVDSWLESKKLNIKDLLNMLDHEDICYFEKMDKEHLSSYPSVSVCYLVKGNILNEFYWISSSNSGSIDYFIDRRVIPEWLKQRVTNE